MSTTEKVTLTLPKELMNHVREMTPPRGQSKFIAEAVEYFIEVQRRKALRERLIAGYQANAEADAALAAEWEAIEYENWELHVPLAESNSHGRYFSFRPLLGPHLARNDA